MDQRLDLACKGKSASQGGMNVPELMTLAVQKGYQGPKRRDHILAFLCNGKQSKPKTKAPAKAAANPLTTKPAKKSMVRHLREDADNYLYLKNPPENVLKIYKKWIEEGEAWVAAKKVVIVGRGQKEYRSIYHYLINEIRKCLPPDVHRVAIVQADLMYAKYGTTGLKGLGKGGRYWPGRKDFMDELVDLDLSTLHPDLRPPQ